MFITYLEISVNTHSVDEGIQGKHRMNVPIVNMKVDSCRLAFSPVAINSHD